MEAIKEHGDWLQYVKPGDVWCCDDCVFRDANIREFCNGFHCADTKRYDHKNVHFEEVYPVADYVGGIIQDKLERVCKQLDAAIANEEPTEALFGARAILIEIQNELEYEKEK